MQKDVFKVEFTFNQENLCMKAKLLEEMEIYKHVSGNIGNKPNFIFCVNLLPGCFLVLSDANSGVILC